MKDKNFTCDFSKAKDYFLKEISFKMSPHELNEDIKDCIEELNIVDVRFYDDYIDGHIPFAIHVPYENLEEHMVMFDRDKLNVVYGYCPYCKLAYKAAYKLAEKNYPTVVLNGGYKIWTKKGFDTIKTSEG